MVPLILASSNLSAHRMDSAMSVIDVAPNGDDIEITHRIFAHDLEHVFELTQTNMDYFESEDGAKLIREYIEGAFYIKTDPNGAKLPLRFIGVELAGDIVYVFFDAKINNAGSLTFDNNILEEYSQRQMNYLNLHFNGQTKSLIFSNGNQEQTLQLR